MSATLGLFWAPHSMTTPLRRPAHRPPKAQHATGVAHPVVQRPGVLPLLMSPGCTSLYSPAKSHQYSVCRARSTTTISRTVASSWRQR
ncbi:hypothetical protein ZEAMMB73_Zm00001d045971 [Zea mays]|uniref:Uncharacterized protein n=1 Tax=Zea mays TaxID=4577 RepID=A0A1D6P0A5_MAIZE|nr:hypothetical protein ZEAMMB73_Zm00001d045971 [Zea mays]